jgi:hypothetical protein
MSESQVLNTTSLDDSNLGKQFMAYVETIITALGITDENMKQKIEEEMSIFDEKSKYKIISDIALKENVKLLLDADEKLHNLVKEGGILHSFYDKRDNKEVWEKSMEQVARLQGLIILRKISHNDCDGLIKSLLGAFDTKLKAVNTILESDLNHKEQAGGSGNDYLVKYLKYKNKYLKLLKNNM